MRDLIDMARLACWVSTPEEKNCGLASTVASWLFGDGGRGSHGEHGRSYKLVGRLPCKVHMATVAVAVWAAADAQGMSLAEKSYFVFPSLAWVVGLLTRGLLG